MNNSDKDNNLKEKLRQALTSTFKVISDDLRLNDKTENNKSSKKFDFFDLENLNTKNDFIKARAESDSLALQKKFSNKEIYQKNLPINSSCKSLYSFAEKIRCECLGGEMLKGVQKNFRENYRLILTLKRKDQLKTREDVNVNEAFELYMLKKFHNMELNSLTQKMLNFWEKDFDQSISKHIKFLKDNLEDQHKYSSKFSEILQELDIFQTEDTEETKQENSDDSQKNPQNEDQNSNDEDDKDQNKQDETEASLDTDYDISEYKLDEQLVDTDSDKQSDKQVIQKNALNAINLEYKIFTNQYDEITKAENLENSNETNKLRKTLDQQLIGFQDIITKLANKLQRQLLAKQNRSWEFDLEEGLLDSSKLPRIIMDPTIHYHLKRKRFGF